MGLENEEKVLVAHSVSGWQGTYDAEIPRLFLQRLSEPEHLQDFWEIWRDTRVLTWSYVSLSVSQPQTLLCLAVLISMLHLDNLDNESRFIALLI
jgi:hypothetical protein